MYSNISSIVSTIFTPLIPYPSYSPKFLNVSGTPCTALGKTQWLNMESTGKCIQDKRQ